MAAEMKNRSAKQIRERWSQNLDPNLLQSPITEEEGREIEKRVQADGKKWAAIARDMGNRSDNQIKNWFNGRMNRRNAHQAATDPTTREHAPPSSPVDRLIRRAEPPTPYAAPVVSSMVTRDVMRNIYHGPPSEFGLQRPHAVERQLYGVAHIQTQQLQLQGGPDSANSPNAPSLIFDHLSTNESSPVATPTLQQTAGTPQSAVATALYGLPTVVADAQTAHAEARRAATAAHYDTDIANQGLRLPRILVRPRSERKDEVSPIVSPMRRLSISMMLN